MGHQTKNTSLISCTRQTWVQWLFKDSLILNTSLKEKEHFKKKSIQLSAITPEERQLID